MSHTGDYINGDWKKLSCLTIGHSACRTGDHGMYMEFTASDAAMMLMSSPIMLFPNSLYTDRLCS